MAVLSTTFPRRGKRLRAIQIAAYATQLSLSDRPDVVDRHLKHGGLRSGRGRGQGAMTPMIPIAASCARSWGRPRSWSAV